MPSRAPRDRRSTRRGSPPTPDRCVVDQTWVAAAPLGTAREQVPEAGAEVGATEHRVGGDTDEQHHGVRSLRAALRRRRVPRPSTGPRIPHPRASVAAIARSTRTVTVPTAAYTAKITRTLIPRPWSVVAASSHPHQVRDDPWLAADLGDDPPRLERENDRRAPASWPAAGTTADGQLPRRHHPTRTSRQAASAVPRSHHQVPREVHDGRLSVRRARRPSGMSSSPEACRDGVPRPAARRRRGSARRRVPAVEVQTPAERSRGRGPGWSSRTSIAANFSGWSWIHRAGASRPRRAGSAPATAAT